MKKIFLSLMAVMATMSINAQIVKVYENGTLTATYTNSSTNTVKVVFEEEPKYVDLGLPSGTLWAKSNIGAETETDAGLYFAWGETTGYTSDVSDGHSFDWASYKWMDHTKNSWAGCLKYTFADGYTSSGWYNTSGNYVGTTVDGTLYANITTLEAVDDAATVNLGSNWCMPTHAQQDELLSNTDYSWTTINGVSGYKFTNKSDASKYIFLPAAGYRSDSGLSNAGTIGSYWSCDLYSGSSNNGSVLYFYSGYIDTAGSGYRSRYCGRSVRAVRK